MRLMSFVGSPTAVNTNNIVTRPADGTLAAPILANVAVKLKQRHNSIKSAVKLVPRTHSRDYNGFTSLDAKHENNCPNQVWICIPS